GCNETPEHKTCVHGSPFRMVVQQRNQDAPSPVPRTPSRVSGWLRGVNLAATIRYRAVTRCTMARPFGVALVAPHWDGETGGSDLAMIQPRRPRPAIIDPFLPQQP